MNAVPVRRVGDPVLRALALPATMADVVTVGRPLQATLAAFRKANGFGRAIAAPQIGYSKRMLAVHLEEGPQLILNPRVTHKSAERFRMWDDCFSFPELMVPVERHCSISMAFHDECGREVHWTELSQSVSELLQHEIDHLDGILSLDIAIGDSVAREVFEKDKDYYLRLIGSTYSITMT